MSPGKCYEIHMACASSLRTTACGRGQCVSAPVRQLSDRKGLHGRLRSGDPSCRATSAMTGPTVAYSDGSTPCWYHNHGPLEQAIK